MSTNLIKLENVYFYYVNVAEPKTDKFDPEGFQKKYGVTVAVSKAEAKEFKKLKLNKNVKEITGEEFTKKYKSIPQDLVNDDDEYFTISFSLNAFYKDRNPIQDYKKPAAYLAEVVDGREVLTNITKTAVGNGSKGDIRLSTRDSVNGVTVSLHSILVRDFIPYSTGDEWASAAAENAPAVETVSGVSTETQAVSEPVTDDDVPF